MNDKVKDLYDFLTNEGYDFMGSEDEFRGKLKDGAKAGELYSFLTNEGYDFMGTYDEFISKVGAPYNTAAANRAAGVGEESNRAQQAQQPTQRNMGTPGYVPNRFGLPTQQQPVTPMMGATPPTPQPQQSRRQYDYRPMQGSSSVQTPAAEQPAYRPQAAPKPKQPTYQQAQQQQPIYNTQAETPATPEFRNTQKMYSDAADKAWQKAEQDTKALREANTKKIEDIYNDEHSTMLGKMAMAQTRATALPIEGMAASLKAHDMEKMADDAWGYVSDDDKEYLIDGFKREIMREAARSGGSGGTMSQEEAEKALREEAERRAKARQYQAMYDKAVAANAPKDVLDFLQRKIVEGNSLSKLAIAAARTIAGTRGDMDARAVATHDYGKGHRVADITGSVLQIATDPVTWAAGGAGKGAVKGATAIAERAAGAAATRKLAASKGGQLAQRMIGGSANFAAFEGLGNIVDQLQQGGVYNEETGQYEYSLKDVAKAAGHGVLLGGATGVVGGLVGNVGDKVFDRVASTAGKLAVRGGQTITSIAAEGTIFAAPELISGEGDFDTWLESVELMAGFKLHHGLKALPGTMGRLMRVPESRAGFETRLRDLLQGRPDLALTNDEREELERGGYTDLSELAEAYKGIEGKLVRMGDEMPYDRFSQLMADNSISEAARAKMYYYVTGRGMVQSTVTAAEIAEHRDHEGNITDYVVKSYNKDGGVITSRTYKSKKAAEVEFGRLTRQSELNSIDMLEKLYDRLPGTDATTAKMLRDVIGRESGIDIDKVIGKEENRRTDEEKAALQEYLNTMARECQDAWDRQHVDVNQQRLQPDWQEAYDMGYNADEQQRSDISIEREDNPNDPQAQAAWQGVEDRIRQDAADRADQRRAEGEKMAYKGKGDMQGAIRPLTINEDSSEKDPKTGKRKKKTVYLVNGTIAIEPNGNGLSREGTDKTIYVYDPETGDTHELDPFGGAGVLEVGEPVSMEDYLADNEQQSQAEVQQAAETAQGKVNVAPNTPFVTPEGRQGIVKSVEGDNVIVQFADGEMEEASIPLADMQQYADALRRQEYEARHPQTPAEQPQQPNTATEGQAPTAGQTAPQEGGNAAEDTRTPAQRTYDDVVAKLGADRASKKIDATAKVKADRLTKAEKALKTAQETADNTEYGSKEEQKAEEAVVKAQAEYDAAQQDMAAWDEVRKLRDQALLAQAEQEEQQRKAELERKRAEETEAQRKQREEYEAEQARRREQAERVRQEDAERLKAQIEREKEEKSNPQPNEPAAPIEGTKGSRSQLEIAREEMADNPEALAMLDDLEPRSLDEIAATLLGGGKRGVKLQREEFKRHTGYSEGEMKRYPFIFASKENGGVTIERLGEMVANEAVNENIPFDELDAMAGANAVLDMLSSVYSQGDINNYIQNKRIAEAREYYNKVKSEAYAMMLDAYGMTEGEYEAYMSWLEDAAEQRQNTLTDEQALELINQAIQQDNERQAETNAGNSKQQSTETTERTKSAETDTDKNGERGNGETDAGTAEVNTAYAPTEEEYAEIKAYMDEHPNASRAELQRALRLGYNKAVLGMQRWESERAAQGATAQDAAPTAQDETPAAEQSEGTAEGEKRDYNKPLKSLAEVMRFLDEIDYRGNLSSTMTTEDGRKFVIYRASGNVSPNIYFGETTPRDILQQFYLYDNIMEVYIPADIWAEFEQEDADRKESNDNYWANEREKAKDILTQANIPFVDVIDSERGIRVVFTDKKNDNGNYTEYMDLSDTEQLQEDIESVRAKAESYKQPKQETKAEKEESNEPKEPKRLISDEQMDELKERLRKKLRGQLNSGFDPEIIEIGLYLAVGHIERGLTKFSDFAKRMIEDLGDAIRPYLKSFYNGARDFPGAEKLAEQMTPYEEVRAFDVENFDKARPSSIVDTAKEIAAEQEIEKQVEKIKKPTKGNKKEDSTLSDTEQGQLDLFGTQTTNNNDNGLERPNAVRTEGGTRGQRTDSTQSGVRTDGERTSQESGGTDGSGESGSVGALGQELQHGLRPNDELAEKRNTRNNHAERGKDYAPKDVDARIEANIAAIERMQQLRDAEKQATPADMAVLRKFSGWGGLGKAFDNYEYSTKLKALLGEEAYEQANLSRYSAFYTPAKITDTLWDIARALGFKGGKVLEGSAGIGNILGSMPTDMSEQSSIEAVEIDPTTGGILSLLYPDAKVNIKGFEETRVPNGSVDLAITNVPFVADMKVPKDETGDADLSSKFKRSIQDFCIAKNVRKLKEGGIGIFITSSGTLDNSEKLRSWLTNEGNADVVGAYRMHKNTFGGASVTTDIIVIRKRVNKQKSAHAIDVSGTTAVRTAKYTHSEWDDKKKDIVEKTDELTMDYNTYFVEHPEMMGGEMKFAFEKGDTYRPTSRALYPKNGVNQDNGLKEFVQSLSGKEWDKASDETTSDTVEYKELGEGITEGSMFVGEDGAFYVAQQGLAVPLEINNNKVKGHTKQECFEAYTAIKDAVSEVLDYETKNAGDEGLQPLLDKLNKAYDDFVSTYGHFQKNTSISFLKNDMGFSNVRALETMTEYNDEQGNRQQSFKKGDIFSKRVVEKEAEPKPTNAKDGVIASMYKYGRIDIPYISKQIGKSEEEVKNEILESGIGFENPQSREVEVTYEYLSGNVREKLRQAQEANENGEFDRNIKALQDIIPMNIPSHLIEFSIGSSWLDPKLYSDYISDRTGISVEMTYFNGMWMPSKVNDWNADTEKNRAMSITSDKVGKTVWGHEMIIAAMQNRTIEMKKVVRDRVTKTKETIADPEATRAIAAKIDEIRADFKDWAREKMQSDPALSEVIEEEYNERFNNFVPKSIPNDFVPEYFGGASRTIKLQPHQAKAAIRATTQPLMIAHEVGAGKTFTLITAAMEMRRIGTARKPMIVVQNATVGQFVESAKTLYPNAKILTLEDAEHNKGGRLAFYSMIKYNDWDMIIVPQSTFNMIPDSEDRKIAYIKEKIEEKEAALDKLLEIEDSESVIKQAENEIADMEAELEEIKQQKADKKKKRDQKRDAMVKKNAATQAKEALDRYVDDVEDFDQMGIDAILVDEAHNYKRLGFATAMRRGVKGIDPAYSKKAQSVFLKAQSVMERTGGKNVIFATGTPISNTAAEIWTFMRYLMPAETLREYDIYYFDDFVRNFGNLTQMLEFSTDGKFKENNRFAGYINMPELARIWSGVADTKLTDDIERERLERGEESKIPDMEGGKATDIYLPQTRALRSVILYVKQTLKEFDNMKPKEKKKNRHIPLVMYGIASRAAVDVRLVLNNGGEVVGHETGGQSVSSGADEPNSKTNEAVRQTLRSLEETKDYKGTVAIFADLYQNKETGFNLYEEIKRKLVEAGVPEEQIAIMKSGMTMKKKLGILDKVNAGEIRVIMGSTATLGTGVNIQERLHTLIHMDAPNRPMDYTQRNGRILRQGNIHKQMGKPVRILRFGVEDSLDVTAYQRLKTKGAIADSVMRSGQLIANSMENRTMEEVEDLFGDAVAQLSGSEYAMLKQQAEREVRKYEAKRKQYESDQTYIHNQKPRLKGQIEKAKQRAAEANAALAKVEKADGEKQIVVGKKTFADVSNMADFFKEYNKKVNEDSERVRKSYMQEKAWRDLPMNIGGFDFNVHLEIEKSYETKGGSMSSVAKRTMTYSCEALGLKDVPVRQGLLRNAVEDIMENVLSGNDFRDVIEAAERSITRNEEALEQMSKREGKPFEFSKELEEAKQRYEEYEQLMKAEMEAKEEKYAEMDAETTAIDASALSNIEDEDEEEDEDTDSDVRFRGEEREREGGEEAAQGEWYDRNSVERIGEFAGYTPKQIAKMNARQEESARNKFRDAAEKLHLSDNITFADTIDDVPGLTDEEREEWRRKKGWYSPRTGKIVIILGNHKSMDDVMKSILHEGVAHHGLRQMFGEHFNTFLDNVYQNAHESIRDEINAMAKKHGWNFREATEEYLAKLAEDTDFEKPQNQSWWGQVKQWFFDMLHKIGFKLHDAYDTITDNELRYILWRSYQNLVHPGRYNSVVEEAKDIAKQYDLKVGQWDETWTAAEAEPNATIEYNGRKIPVWATNGRRENRADRSVIKPSINLNEIAEIKAEAENDGFVAGIGIDMTMTDGNVYHLWVGADKEEEDYETTEFYQQDYDFPNEEMTKRFGKFFYENVNKIFGSIIGGYIMTSGQRGFTLSHDEIMRMGGVRNNRKGSDYNVAADGVAEDGVRFRDGEDEESDGEERESIEQLANDMSIGTAARFAAIAARNAQESHDNAEALAAALNFTSQNLAEIVKATKAQKKFDKATVKQVTDMARVMVSAGYLDSMGRADVKGLLKAIRESTGETDNTDNVNRIIDIMVKNQLKNQENTLATLLKIKGSRVDARGINVQGKLDPNGQQVIKSFKDNMKEQRETIESRIADAEERMTSENKAIADAAYNEKVGLQLALDYVEKIGQSKADEKDIEAKKRAELSKVYDYTRVVDVDEQGNALFKKDGTERTHEVRHVRAEYKGKISDEKKAERERVEQTAAAMDDAIRHMRMERIDAYTDFIAQVAGNMKESMRKLEERREAEKRRIEEIHHNANSDMEGRPASEHRSDTGGVLNWINNAAGGTLFAPLASFGEMLRMFGRKSPNGEGYLFNRFMRGLIDARHKELNGVHDKYSELDKKAQAVFGGKVETWADMMNVVRKGENIAVEWFDGKEKVPHTLHQGNLMYIYMVNKMSDGRMKLRHMGIDEKAMAVIESKLDPRLKEIADWLQDDFLVRSRNEYNETHKRMFGASMSAIEDYFPLVINSGSRNKDAEKEDAAENNPNTITTATGAIKKRTVNVVDLDLLNSDAMHVILDHIAEMEHWNAFAEYNRDLNTLRSYKRFENQVKNMTTILGDGEQTWKAFNKTAQIAVGSYQKAQSDLDAKSLEFASKVTAAKVAFRINTALKQLLSLPAYLPYANASGFYHALANDLGNGTAPWKWCMENLPMYRERWESRVSGDPRLVKLTNDWNNKRHTTLRKIARAGMLPNAAVDALTVSIGAHAVYETRKAQYLKEGYSEAAAEKRAIQDAEIAYNETQQSSEGGFVSVMQVDKSWLNVLFTIFRNASMAYQRQLHGALRNLINMRTKARREQAKEFLAKQIARDGVNEAQARLAAEQRFNRAMRKNWIAVATFGYIVQFAWNFGGQMWYLLFGDDDDKKKKTWKDILIHSLFGGVEGLTGGDWLSELGRQIATGDRNPQSLNKDMPLTSDMLTIIEKFGQGREWEAVSDIINLAVQAGFGANPQTLTDIVVATIDACNGDLGLAREAGLWAMRVIQVPQSQTEQIYFDEIGMTGEEARKLSYEQLVERYAKYRVKRNYFWTFWEWDNEKALEKGEKRGERIVKERMETMSDEQLEEALSNLFESSGEKGKKLSFNQYAKREGLKGYDYSDATKNDGAKYYMNIATWRDIAEDITLHHETKRLEDEIRRLKKLGVRENEVAYWQTDDKLKDLNKVKKEIGEMKKEMVDANGNPMSEEIINSRMENIRKKRRKALYPEQAANPTDNVEE